MAELEYEKRDSYAIFTMNRPERLNALGGDMNRQFQEAVDDFTADPAMRAGIVTGAGRAFSAGMDLKEAAERGAAGGSVVGGRPDQVVPRGMFSDNPKPFIAAINGLAVGGGLERALDCDIRICSTAAYVGLFEPKRGIIPGSGVHSLPRVIGMSAANYVLLTADRISPEQALQWGIVSEVVEPDQLMPRAAEIAEMIAENAPRSVEAIKSFIQGWRKEGYDHSYQLYRWAANWVFDSEDAHEGPAAFAEKRRAVWKGR